MQRLRHSGVDLEGSEISNSFFLGFVKFMLKICHPPDFVLDPLKCSRLKQSMKRVAGWKFSTEARLQKSSPSHCGAMASEGGAAGIRTLVRTWPLSSLLHVYSVLIFEIEKLSDVPNSILEILRYYLLVRNPPINASACRHL